MSMGFGKRPVNIFRLRLGDDPPEVLNWRLWFAVVSFGVMGTARGIDEGLISGTFASPSLQHLLGFDKLDDIAYANVKGNVSAMVQIGSVFGALLAFVVADRLGRLWTARQLCVLWIAGIIIFLTNDGRLGQVYAGRFIAGVGIGETTVVAPIYISEIAPKSVRGLCTCIFSGSVYIGIMLAYFATWGSSRHIDQDSNISWIIPTMLHIIFASLILGLSFFNHESPRYLIKKGQVDIARTNLARTRGLPEDNQLVLAEIGEIRTKLQEEQDASSEQGLRSYIREIFLKPNNLYRIYLGLGIQLLSQWSGAGSITLYAPDIFALLGTKSENQKLFATSMFGVTKFLASIICALFLVDVVGRKRSLCLGISLQALSMVYIAVFLTIAPTIGTETNLPLSQKSASLGAIVMIYISGFGWAMGWNSTQYLLNAEIYPLRIRSICSSMVMCFHFINQYGSSRAAPHMLLPSASGGLSPMGTFWMFAIVTIIGGIWAWIQIPETAGMSLENMDALFESSWYKIGLKGRCLVDRGSETIEQGEAVTLEPAQQTGDGGNGKQLDMQVNVKEMRAAIQ